MGLINLRGRDLCERVSVCVYVMLVSKEEFAITSTVRAIILHKKTLAICSAIWNALKVAASILPTSILLCA